MSEKLEKKVKKNNSGIIILSILLVLVILIFAFYVLFDQGIIKLGGAKVEEEVKEEVVEVNVKSRLVNYLYNSVANASDGNDWYRFWRYQNGFTDQLVDFYSKSAPEKVKMQLVAKNINDSFADYIYNCEDGFIPDNNEYGNSACWYRKEYNEYRAMVSFEREYIESIYKQLFGSDAQLDTSVDFKADLIGASSYKYIPKYDRYFEYQTSGGVTTGPGGYVTKLEKALKEGNKIYIYEDVVVEKYDGNDNKIGTENYYMVYTFELEDDGMYKFISRVKKDK